jgi:hypothetical protein
MVLSMLSRNGRVVLAFAVLGALYAFQQPFRQYPGQEYANFPLPPDWREKTEWMFARLMYPPHPTIGLYRTRGPWQNGWAAWTNDYPRADRHFTEAVRRLTRLNVRSVEQPVNLDDGDDVYNYPWLYAVQAGSMNLTDEQAAKLRDYLLHGGFLVCDDFWGTLEWGNFERNMHLIFPDRAIVEIEETDPTFHTVFDLTKTPIPGEWSLRSGRPYRNDGVDPHWRAIYDDTGRMMIAIWYNIDAGDSWEWADYPEYPEHYSALGIRMGINFIVYSMTH